MSLNISDFNFFYVKIKPSLLKKNPSFPGTPAKSSGPVTPSKSSGPVKTPSLFENLVGGSIPIPLSRKRKRVEEGRCTLCNCISRCETLGQKKVVLFPKISQVEIFLSLTRPWSRICIRMYIFHLEKQINKQTKKWRFFSSPAFPETRVFLLFLFMALCWIFWKKIIKIKYSMISLDFEISRCANQQPYICFCRFHDTCRQLRKNKIGRFEAEELAVTGKNFRLSQKERFLEPIEKKTYIVNYWWAAVAPFWWSQKFIYFFFILLQFCYL